MSIGIHCDKLEKTSLTGSLIKTFDVLKGAKCAQIFTHGPRSSSLNNFDDHKIRELCSKYNIYVHQTYRTSWKELMHIQEQFSIANSIGAKGVVLHLGKISPEDHVAVLKQIRTEIPAILEMRALTPGKWSYQTTQEINELCKAMNDAKLNYMICLDTAHINAGKIKLRTAEDALAYISKLEFPDKIGLLHLNGNTYNSDERAGDCHCIPLAKEDFVFREIDIEKSGAVTLAKWFLSRGKDVILEQDFTPELVAFHALLNKTVHFE